MFRRRGKILVREQWKTIRTISKGFFAFLITVVIAYVLVQLADKNVLNINIVIKTIIELSGTIYINWTITGIAVIWAFRERRLRRIITNYLTNENDLLQRMLWPDKKSSGINKDGTTTKEDRL